MHFPCSGMTPNGQAVQGEQVLLKLGIWKVFPIAIVRLAQLLLLFDCFCTISPSGDGSGPKGRPNNLPQPAWCLAELFFWSDLSWSRADLCANSYVISTRFSLFGGDTMCTRYISYIGIECIIQFRIIRIYNNIDICRIRHYRFSTYLWLFIISDFWITCTYRLILFFWYFISWCLFLMKKRLCHQIVFRPEFFTLFAWVYDNICYGLQHIRSYFFSCDDFLKFFFIFFSFFLLYCCDDVFLHCSVK